MDHYIVSARKYRPSTFDSVVGQKALTATLKNAIASGRLAHSYLFCGSRGVGKTSCARIFAKTINCLSPTPEGEACNECDSCRAFNEGNSLNIIELDAASNNSVDDIRQLVEQVQIPPGQGRYRVFIVDEVHMLSSAAFNAFLKTLEEPPSYVIFILATTEKHKIIPTILSRCQIYDFNRITVRDMVDHLTYVAKSEGITAEPSALNIIARKADGAMRDALSIFDQVAASSRGNITYRSTIDNLNVLDFNYYNRLLDCFLEGKVLDSWLIYKEIRDKGFDSHFFINGVADYMRDLMVARDPSTIVLLEADDDARKAMAEKAVKCHPEFIYRAMNLCNEADLNYRTASNKQFLVELTLAKICQLLSPSPGNSGEGGGQLQKIADSNTPSAPAQQPATTAAAPAAPNVQPKTPVTATPAQTSTSAASPQKPVTSPLPPPAAPPAGKRIIKKTGIGTFSISGNDGNTAQQSSSLTPAATQQRDAAYTPEQLNSAWQSYIKAHPTSHILINTMRASFPSPMEGHTYRVMVENEKQREEMISAMPSILSTLHDATSNDHIMITVEINQGEASPHTWNERQVLNHMVENNPGLRDFIDDMQLTIG
ncbi:DNA polymerase III subunit gamma/tau [Duncaniella freteri]|uniref:DNA polymerase III subunit gamma/tau n=2 Tax=Duncaniella TaxID=2518495 RepID=UPI0013690C2D|nr:DNA polymerase III subunit gamma/tau [Duncaniella freteri]NBJ08583.1 DNA polymerase III subunit gamma/tau [Alistipes sp. Z76]NCE70593.1 DNA polymerase III subunit gamma/tau [Muribaculaceae bacterium M3]